MKLPKSWSDVSLMQLHQLNEIQESNLNNVEKCIQRLMVLTGRPREEFAEMLLTDLHRLHSSLDFIDTLPPKEVPKAIKVKGIEYRVNNDITKMNSGRILDMIVTSEAKKDEPVKGMAYLCSMMCLEAGERYDYDRCMARAEDFYQHMSVADGHPIAGFFLHLWSYLLVSIQDFSMERLNTLTREMIEDVLKSSENSPSIGDGSAT